MGLSTVLATVLDILPDVSNFLEEKNLSQLTINIPCQAELPKLDVGSPATTIACNRPRHLKLASERENGLIKQLLP